MTSTAIKSNEAEEFSTTIESNEVVDDNVCSGSTDYAPVISSDIIVLPELIGTSTGSGHYQVAIGKNFSGASSCSNTKLGTSVQYNNLNYVIVAFYRGDIYGNFFDKVVGWWTSSKYSHVAIIIGDTWYTSSPSKGVHAYKEPEFYALKWDFVEVELDPFDVTCRAEALLGAKYDFMGLFGFVLRPAVGVSNRWFCSEFVAHCLGMQDAWRYDPATLYSALTYCKK